MRVVNILNIIPFGPRVCRVEPALQPNGNENWAAFDFQHGNNYLRFERYAFIWFYLMSQVCGGLRWQVCWQVRWRWQLAMAMRVAVSELVASLMAESDGKKKGKPCFGGKRGGNYSWQKIDQEI